MAFDRKSLIVPDCTKFEESTIITTGDVIIGDRCLVQFGIKTDGRIFVGEHVIIDGDLEATNDIRIDIFSNIGGNIKSGRNVYLGEKVKVNGKLSLGGDLDVGDSVEIIKGFEAKGWINIRNPIPIVVYIFIYLLQLLKMGHSEEIERILKEMEENEEDTIPISETFFFIPNNSIIGNQKSKLDYSVTFGKKSRILGNYDINGNVLIQENSEVHGTINSSGNVFCEKKSNIKGNINSDGDIKIEDMVTIFGNINGNKIYLSKTATIYGELFAKNGITFSSIKNSETEEKIERFVNNTDIIEEVNDMMEQ